MEIRSTTNKSFLGDFFLSWKEDVNIMLGFGLYLTITQNEFRKARHFQSSHVRWPYKVPLWSEFSSLPLEVGASGLYRLRLLYVNIHIGK